MTDRELMQQALEAMLNFPDDISDEMFESIRSLRARLAQPEPEPVAWVAYENGEKHGIDFDEDEIAELPVGTMLYPAPPHFLDPAKVARLIDEAFERGKKEIDMEQVKDIAHKLADCALLNSTPPQREWMERERAVGYREGHQAALKQREWQGLTTQEIVDETDIATSSNKDIFDFRKAFWCGARWAEEKLKEKNAL